MILNLEKLIILIKSLSQVFASFPGTKYSLPYSSGFSVIDKPSLNDDLDVEDKNLGYKVFSIIEAKGVELDIALDLTLQRVL